MTAHALRRDVQGLRAIAVLLVVAAHARLPGFTGGFVGVDVFFVISGFLITGQLARMLDTTGRIDFAGFYARRARRILPAAAVVVVLTLIAAALWVAPVRLAEVVRHGVAALLSGANIVFAVDGTDYFAETVPSPFRQYWSLGVEEQFYLLWPLLLLGLWALARRRALLVAGVTVLVAASFAAAVAETAVQQPFAYFLLPFRAWELGVGGLLALLPVARIPTAAKTVLSWAGIAGIALAVPAAGDGAAYPGVVALLPAAAAAAVIAGDDAPAGATAVLRFRPVQFVGAISYSLYLVHWPILVMPREATQWSVDLPLQVDLLLAALSVGVAWLLYRFVETPARSLRLPNRTTLAAAGVATAVLAGGALTGAALAERPVLASTRQAPRSTALALDPPGAAFVPADLSPSLTTGFGEFGALRDLGCQQTIDGAGLITCSFGDTRSPRTVALFGDSHAGRLFRAFEGAAERNGFRLETFVKSSCRSIDTDAKWSAQRGRNCGQWRDDALARLRADPPDVIAIANHTSDQKLSAGLPWAQMVHDSIGRLPATSKVVFVTDSPQLPRSPLYCLSAHVDASRQCAVPRSAAFDPASRSAILGAAEAGRVGVIDLTGYFCNRRTCPAIIGDTLVYTDDHHITDEFSTALAGPVADALRPWLPRR